APTPGSRPRPKARASRATLPRSGPPAPADGPWRQSAAPAPGPGRWRRRSRGCEAICPTCLCLRSERMRAPLKAVVTWHPMDIKSVRVLVTGGSGQLGAYLLRELVHRGTPTAAWSGARPGNRFGFLLRTIDLTDTDQTAAAFHEERPDVVIHAA